MTDSHRPPQVEETVESRGEAGSQTPQDDKRELCGAVGVVFFLMFQEAAMMDAGQLFSRGLRCAAVTIGLAPAFLAAIWLLVYCTSLRNRLDLAPIRAAQRIPIRTRHYFLWLAWLAVMLASKWFTSYVGSLPPG